MDLPRNESTFPVLLRISSMYTCLFNVSNLKQLSSASAPAASVQKSVTFLEQASGNISRKSTTLCQQLNLLAVLFEVVASILCRLYKILPRAAIVPC